MQTKRTILTALTRHELRATVDDYDVRVDDRRVKTQLVDALAVQRRVRLGDVLQGLSRDRLKELCRAFDVDVGAEVRDALAAFPQPVLTAAIRNRTEYAAALRVGQTALDTKPSGPAARDIVTLTDEIRAIALHEEDRHVQHR